MGSRYKDKDYEWYREMAGDYQDRGIIRQRASDSGTTISIRKFARFMREAFANSYADGSYTNEWAGRFYKGLENAYLCSDGTRREVLAKIFNYPGDGR